ncbi:MAG: CotH kinase family protein [Candidatus Omnitrophica bacterium]|nr:CotH kinase family protein [Candidatus Omnitrophota bacterium]
MRIFYSGMMRDLFAWAVLTVCIGFVPPLTAAADSLDFSDITKIDLYVTSRTVAKAERAFSNRSFRKGKIPGTFEVRPGVNYFTNPLEFSYAEGFVRLNDGPKRDVQWRFRGLTQTHWQSSFPERSMKINFLKNKDLLFDVLNLSIIDADPLMRDAISYEIYHAYGLITPRIQLVRFYINGSYAGFRTLVENPDDHFLIKRGLSTGNIYRENSFSVMGDKLNSGIKYFQRRWVKKSLEREKNWDDWVHFNHVLNLFNRGTSAALLDTDYFAKWMAISLLLPLQHMIDHNIYLYHSLKTQKWYQIPWDPTVSIFDDVKEGVLYYAPNKLYAVFLRNVHNFYARNQQAWKLLNDDAFFENLARIIAQLYEKYEAEYLFCKNQSIVCDGVQYHNIDWEEIHKQKTQVHELLSAKREAVKKIFYELPTYSVQHSDTRLIITGMAPLEFKFEHKGWAVESYDNLFALQQSADQSVFLIEPDPGASRTYRGNRHVTIQAFKIVLRPLDRRAGSPQFVSLYGNQRREVVSKGEDFSEMSKKAAVVNKAPITSILDWSRIQDGFREWISAIEDGYMRLNNRADTQDLLERFALWLDKFRYREHLASGKEIHWQGEKLLKSTTVVPSTTTLIVDPGTVVKLGRKVSLIVHGTLKINGKPGQEVLFTSISPVRADRDAWGSVCFINSISEVSHMSYAVIENGSEAHEMGIHCKGAISAYHVPIVIEHSEFRNSHADDAVNILYSKAKVTDSYFHNNKSDALDSDFSQVDVRRVRFENNGNDGLDLGTSIGFSKDNLYLAQGDKGISVGEQSQAQIIENVFIGNDKGVAMKDGSDASIQNNVFFRNAYGVKAYIKKSKFEEPKMTIKDNYAYLNTADFHHDGSAMDVQYEYGFESVDPSSMINKVKNNWLKGRFADYVRTTTH